MNASRVGATAGVLALAAVLGGCGGDGDDALAGPVATSPADPKSEALKVAIQGYIDALLKGNSAAVIGYLDPRRCDDDDEAVYAAGARRVGQMARGGAKIEILTVKLYGNGNRGGPETVEVSKSTPDALRELTRDVRHPSWIFRDGEWYLTGDCQEGFPGGVAEPGTGLG